MFTVTPGSTLNPMSPDFGGWILLLFMLVFAIGLVMFGFERCCGLSSFPLCDHSWSSRGGGVESSRWKPGGQVRQFATPWSGVVDIGGEFQWRRGAIPDALIVTITARGAAVHQNALIGNVRTPEIVTYRPMRELKVRQRDVLVFLREVHVAHTAHR